MVDGRFARLESSPLLPGKAGFYLLYGERDDVALSRFAKALHGDTIVAPATAPGEAAVGIVRVSGPLALDVADRLFRRAKGRAGHWETHRAYFGRVVDPESGEAIDEAILLVMRGPRSFTGEDVVEFQCHGGPVVLNRVLESVLACGARLAEPGEFTQRAFINGRLDLSQAEAVIDLIRSRGDAGRRAALEQLQGRLSHRVRSVRERLLRVLAHMEALIDFPEDEVGDLAPGELEAMLAEAEETLARMVDSFREGRVVREGVRVAIAGRPNAGKSSLLNALVGAERALVTEVPGTTRDVIEETVNVGGIPLVLMDTAGIRSTMDPVERLGVERSRAVLAGADVVLFVVDDSRGLEDEDRAVAELVPAERTVLVVNKCDLGLVRVDRGALARWFPGRPLVEVSALRAEGLQALAEAVRAAVVEGRQPDRESVLVTRARHRDALARALEGVRSARRGLAAGLPAELTAVDLQAAVSGLGEVTGDTVEEEILDVIFREFCIGK